MKKILVEKKFKDFCGLSFSLLKSTQPSVHWMTMLFMWRCCNFGIGCPSGFTQHGETPVNNVVIQRLVNPLLCVRTNELIVKLLKRT